MTQRLRTTAARTDRRMSFSANLRAAPDPESRSVSGHAAVFNTWSQNLGGFIEQIEPGAFERAIREDDVRALWNHDAGQVLARSVAGKGTLRLSEDSTGLLAEWDMPDGPMGDFFLESIKRGDVSQMSFNFIPDEETWEYPEEGPAKVSVRSVQLFDVSPVTYPAYEETDLQLRSMEADRRTRGLDPAAVADPETESEDDVEDQAAIDAELDEDLDLEIDVEVEAALNDSDELDDDIDADRAEDGLPSLDEDDEDDDEELDEDDEDSVNS